MKIWRMMGHYNAETATYSACAGTSQTSPWTPDFNGRLIGLRTQMSIAAATSLLGHVQFRITCANFKPNEMHAYAVGEGLATAPASPLPTVDFPVDQQIVAGVPINVEGRCTDAVPVTVEAYLYGCFEVS